MGSVGILSELCASTAWAVTALPWEPHPPTVPLLSIPGCGRGDQSISSPHGPPATITVEGGCASREQ